jgi:hypothetical protein
MPYRHLPTPTTDLAALDTTVETLLSAGTHAPSTQNTYARTYARFEAWCHTHGLDPLCGDARVVVAFCSDVIGPAAANTVKGVFHAVSWRWQQEGLPAIPTGKGTIAKSAATQLARSRATVEKKGASALPPSVWARVLTVPTPTPTLEVSYARAALLVAHALGSPLGADGRVADIAVDNVTVDDANVRIASGTDEDVVLDATGGVDCPVSAVQALLEVVHDRELLFGLIIDGDGAARAADREAAAIQLARLHRSVCKALTSLNFGSPGSLKRPVETLAPGDAVARLCWLVDLPLCRWLHDQFVLVYQVFGGFRPVTLAAAERQHASVIRGNATITAAVAFHLHRSKGDQLGAGHTVTMPALPDHPTLCPVQLTQLWTWLLGLGPADPLLPPGTPRSIYRTFHQHTPADAARSRFAAPLKRRLELLGEDINRRAGTSGRHSLATVAAEAGLDVIQIADHLGQRSTTATTHYIASSQSRAAATQMSHRLPTRPDRRTIR